MSAFACVVVPYFAAAALERVEPSLRERPLAAVTGTPPATRVIDANDPARAHGVHPGITEAEARARCPDLSARPLSDAVAAAARHALLDATLVISPRVEDAGGGVVHVDTHGLARLIGDAEAVGKRLVKEARAVGFTAMVGLAESRAAARVAARLGRPVTVIPPGRERAMLAPAPIVVLEPDPKIAAVLTQWGIRTVGDLATLPRAELSARLGAPGVRLHELACGEDRDLFTPYSPPPFYQDAQHVEWELTTLAQVAEVLTLVLERLCARLALRHLVADVVDLDLTLTTAEHHHVRVPFAYPLRDRPAMVTLALQAVESNPPRAAATALAVTAHPVRALPGQHGLWEPRLPASRDLATILTRLSTLVGADAVGSPLLVDSHRPDAVTLTTFALGAAAAATTDPPARRHAQLMLRRVRPPRPITVEADDAPRAVTWNGVRYGVTTAAGPWRLSGEWWDVTGWARDEWDVALADGTLCRVARDLRTGTWLLDGVYD